METLPPVIDVSMPYGLGSIPGIGDVEGIDASIFSRFVEIREPGEYSLHLADCGVVKPQAFKEPIVFYLDREKKQALLYRQPIQGVLEVSSKAGVLKGVHPADGPGARDLPVVPISGKMVREAITAANFSTEFFQEEVKEPKDVELTHGFVNSVGYAAGDPWAIVSCSIGLYATKYHAPTDPGVMNRFTSSFGALTGTIKVLNTVKGYRVANRIGDHEGQSTLKLKFVGGVLEMIGGGVMIAVRAVSLAAIRAADSKVILVVSKVLGWLSTAVSSLMFLFIIIPGLIDVVRGGKFLISFNSKLKEGNNPALRFLIGLVGLNKENIEEIVKSIKFDSPEALYDMVKDGVKSPEGFNESLTKDEMIAIEDRVHTIMAMMNPSDYPLIGDWDQVRDYLLVKALTEASRLVEKKKAEYTRRAGNGSYSELREKMMEREIRFNGFEFTYDSKTIEEFACSVIELSKEETHTNLFINSFVIIACIIGIASFIGANIFSGGAPLIVSLVALVVMNLMLSGVDFYALIGEIKALKKVYENDIVAQVIFLIMTLFSLAVAIVFNQCLAAQLIVVAIGAVMLTLQIGALEYSYSKYKETKNSEEAELEKKHQQREIAHIEDSRAIDRLRARVMDTLAKLGMSPPPLRA